MNLKIPQTVSHATQILEDAGFQAYIVGGSLRDLYLDIVPTDWDVATSATPEEIIALFPKTFYENRFGTVTVVNEEETDETLKNIEITPFRSEAKYSDSRHPDSVSWAETIEDDLSRRDFTFNALAYREIKGQLIDPYNGLNDIKDKLIRAVGKPKDRFQEDPLRILRGIRLAIALGFTIADETAQAMRETATELKKISAERIRDEFNKIIISSEPLVGLNLTHKLGVLSQFLPELEEGVHVKQNGEHIYDVWEHTLRVLQHAADKNSSLEVRLAALFHDIGKPRTRRFSEEKNDYTFYGHEVVGARMAKEILNRLKYPAKVVENVTKLVRNHMFFTDIDRISLSAVRRIIRNVGREHIWELMNVRMADRIGMGRPKEEGYRLRKYESMIEEALRAPTSVGMLNIDGREVLRETGLKAGPKVGQILHALLEEVLENPDLNDKEYLMKRSVELSRLPDDELAKLGDSGKEAKEEKEGEELAEIRKKFHVK